MSARYRRLRKSETIRAMVSLKMPTLSTAFKEKPGGWCLDQRWFCSGASDIRLCRKRRRALGKTTLRPVERRPACCAYRHGGFWKPMDTLRDKIELEDQWNSGAARWKVWQGRVLTNRHEISDAFWKGKTVFLTGHTGFREPQSIWLHALGAGCQFAWILPHRTEPAIWREFKRKPIP